MLERDALPRDAEGQQAVAGTLVANLGGYSSGGGLATFLTDPRSAPAALTVSFPRSCYLGDAIRLEGR